MVFVVFLGSFGIVWAVFCFFVFKGFLVFFGIFKRSFRFFWFYDGPLVFFWFKGVVVSVAVLQGFLWFLFGFTMVLHLVFFLGFFPWFPTFLVVLFKGTLVVACSF